MNQAEVSKLVSKLRIPVLPKHRNLKNSKGPEGRIDKLRKTVTALIKFERLELNYSRSDEARQYTERLISEAIRHGDCHKPTMDSADFWLLEKELIHKLFKVLVPRFESTNLSYTKQYSAPQLQYGRHIDKVVLELRGNPFPNLLNKTTNNKLLIQNVLLDAAKYDYRKSKVTEIASKIGKIENASQDKISNDKQAIEKPTES